MALREISAVSNKLPARRDWTFTFADTAEHRLGQGEPRIRVDIAGDQVIDAEPLRQGSRGLERQHTSEQSLLGVLGVAHPARGDDHGRRHRVRDHRLEPRRLPARFAFAVFGLVFVVGIVQVTNNWPLLESRLRNDQPLDLQQSIAIIAAGLGQLITAAMAALLAAFTRCIARAPRRSRAACRWWPGSPPACS